MDEDEEYWAELQAAIDVIAVHVLCLEEADQAGWWANFRPLVESRMRTIAQDEQQSN